MNSEDSVDASRALLDVYSLVLYQRNTAEFGRAKASLLGFLEPYEDDLVQKIKLDSLCEVSSDISDACTFFIKELCKIDDLDDNLPLTASELLDLIPNLFEMNFDDRDFLDVERLFWITSNSHNLQSFSLFLKAAELVPGHFHAHFFDYFQMIVDLSSNSPLHLQYIALTGILRDFYGENGSMLMNCNKEAVNAEIEKYLCFTDTVHQPSSVLTLLTAKLRCYCGQYAKGVVSVPKLWRLVANITGNFANLMYLTDVQLQDLASDQKITIVLKSMACFLPIPELNLSVLRLMSVVFDFANASGDRHYIVFDIIATLKVIAQQHKKVHKRLIPFLNDLFRDIPSTLRESEVTAYVQLQVDKFMSQLEIKNSVGFMIRQTFNIDNFQDQFQAIGEHVISLWRKHDTRLPEDFFRNFVNLLILSTTVHFKRNGGEVMSLLDSIEYCSKHSEEIQDVLLYCFNVIVSQSHLYSVQDLQFTLENLVHIPTHIKEFIRCHLAEFEKGQNAGYLTSQLSMECPLIPAELMRGLTFLRTQLHSKYRCNRLWARNICEIHDIPLSLMLMLSLSIDGVENPKMPNGKVDHMVLFTGNKGTGKSTTINYLTGTIYEEREDAGLNTILVEAPGQPRPATRVGHEGKAVTLYPHVIYGANGLNLADCPGVRDSRRTNNAVCSKLAVPLAIHFTKRVTAVVIMLEWAMCKPNAGGRGDLLKDLCRILSNMFKQRFSNAGEESFDLESYCKKFPKGMSPIIFLVTKVEADKAHRKPDKLRNAFIVNVKSILKGQTGAYADADKIPERLAHLSKSLQELDSSSSSKLEYQRNRAETEAKVKELKKDYKELMGEKQLLNMMCNELHKIFFIRPGLADDKENFLQYIKKLQENYVHVSHDCFSFDANQGFPEVVKLVNDSVEENRDLLRGLVHQYENCGDIDTSIERQRKVISAQEALFASIFSGQAVGARNPLLEQKIDQSIAEYEGVIGGLEASIPKHEECIRAVHKYIDEIKNEFPVEYGSKAQSGFAKFEKATGIYYFGKFKYSFPQLHLPLVIPIHRIEISCVVDQGQGPDRDLRVHVCSLPPKIVEPYDINLHYCTKIGPNGTVAKERADVQQRGIFEVQSAENTVVTGSFQVMNAKFEDGKCDIVYRMFRGGEIKCAAIRAFVEPKYLPQNVALINKWNKEIECITDIIQLMNDALKDNKIELAKIKGRRERLQSGLGDNPKDKLELIMECADKLELDYDRDVVQKYFDCGSGKGSLTRADKEWLVVESNINRLRKICNSNSPAIWNAFKVTQVQLWNILRGDSDSTSFASTAIVTNFEQGLLDEQLESEAYKISDMVSRLNECAVNTGLLVETIKALLRLAIKPYRNRRKSEKQVLLELFIQKHVSNSIFYHLIRKYLSRRRDLKVVTSLIDLLKINEQQGNKISTTNFISDLQNIENLEMEWKSFASLSNVDLAAVKTAVLNYDEKSAKELSDRLDTVNMTVPMITDTVYRPRWSQLMAINSVENETVATTANSVLYTLTGVDSALACEYIAKINEKLRSRRKSPTILFFGLTRSGKSSVINQLLGVKYSSGDDGLKPDGAESAIVGSGFQSETLCPEFYTYETPDGDASLNLCELPSLDITGTNTEKFCSRFCLPLVAGHCLVKTFCVVISWKDLIDESCAAVNRLMDNLNEYISRDCVSLKNSLFFVFSHAPAIITSTSAIEHLNASLAKHLKSSKNPLFVQLCLLILLNPTKFSVFHENGNHDVSNLMNHSTECSLASVFSCHMEKSLLSTSTVQFVSELVTKFDAIHSWKNRIVEDIAVMNEKSRKPLGFDARVTVDDAKRIVLGLIRGKVDEVDMLETQKTKSEFSSLPASENAVPFEELWCQSILLASLPDVEVVLNAALPNCPSVVDFLQNTLWRATNDALQKSEKHHSGAVTESKDKKTKLNDKIAKLEETIAKYQKAVDSLQYKELMMCMQMEQEANQLRCALLASEYKQVMGKLEQLSHEYQQEKNWQFLLSKLSPYVFVEDGSPLKRFVDGSLGHQLNQLKRECYQELDTDKFDSLTVQRPTSPICCSSSDLSSRKSNDRKLSLELRSVPVLSLNYDEDDEEEGENGLTGGSTKRLSRAIPSGIQSPHSAGSGGVTSGEDLTPVDADSAGASGVTGASGSNMKCIEGNEDSENEDVEEL